MFKETINLLITQLLENSLDNNDDPEFAEDEIAFLSSTMNIRREKRSRRMVSAITRFCTEGLFSLGSFEISDL